MDQPYGPIAANESHVGDELDLHLERPSNSTSMVQTSNWTSTARTSKNNHSRLLPVPSPLTLPPSSSSSALILSKHRRTSAMVDTPQMMSISIENDPDYIRRELSLEQKRCLSSIIACLLPHHTYDLEFSKSYFSTFMTFLSIDPMEFEPLLDRRVDPLPFVEDMELTNKTEKGRVVIGVLLFTTSTFRAYDARIRVLLMSLCDLFSVKRFWLVQEEAVLVAAIKRNSLITTATSPDLGSSRFKQWAKVGAAVVVSSTLFVVTAGIAAPALGAGVVALGAGSGIGAFIGSLTGTALISGLFGATGGGLAGYKMNKRVRGIREFEFVPFTPNETIEWDQNTDPSMLITICIAGMLNKEFGYESLFSSLLARPSAGELYILKWETPELLNAGDGIGSFAKYQVGSAVFQETLKQTLLMGVMNALAWPSAFITASYLIDNPWSIIISRADKASLLLADALLARSHGHRPVTLVGFSVGARVIYKALLELSAKGKEGQGIVQDAILLGCPESAKPDVWGRMQTVVAGRLINGYSKSDWVLRFIFRAASPTLTVCGLEPVHLDTVENIDLSAVVEGHHTYLSQLSEILEIIQIAVS
uniref:DUF726 domain-containing protein n=1 Tax=Spongospora subterranea TaxID=70186 RepID=A0A0H5R761_9EUKA|eukprot:CRZ09975.1 hypothetical protein [Spongospora subterranea]